MVINKRVTVVDLDGEGTGVIGDLCGFTATPTESYGVLLLPDGRFEEYAVSLLRVLSPDGNISIKKET